MSFQTSDYLRHILDETAYLIASSPNLEKASFRQDATLRRAFVRSIKVIGEATQRLPRDYRKAHPQVDWRSLTGLSDRLLHAYFGVDYDLVWDVVINKVPLWQEQISELLTKEDAE
ncbi:MAG: DUF86 domain-containing protein [Leptolyngbyaceae cyanobacterium SM1_1_3]|nr:DUF86 domain-containing protein [Leptolyngbyaceae cyanobacterium SM1_1_3]NJN02488.1 DUF86 domain-containing protein [Leptolyngbyaceae cyanobacterium RM1_1_2]NJO11652.1 DUF86 domain-containing protein [Leptolyngbyaceae cyanobacterium SL_1_1]